MLMCANHYIISRIMRANISRTEILEGNIVRGLIKLSIPLMVLNIINVLYGIVDTFFVGKIGELQVAAVSLISPITNCAIAFGTGLSVAGIAMISRALGKGDKQKANQIATHLIILAIIAGVLITGLSIIFRKQILSWLNVPSDIYEDTYNHFIAVSFDYVGLFVLTMFQAIRQSCGDSSSGAKLNIIASILNGCFDPVYIFVFNMGTFGAGLSTVLSKLAVIPFCLYSLYSNKDDVHISLTEYKFDYKIMRRIILIAIPSSLGQLLSSFGFVLMSKEIVSYGSIVMSGYGIGNSISSIFYIPSDSIGAALPTYIGQNLGAKNEERAKQSYNKSILLVAIISVIVIILGFLTSKYIVLLFVSNASDTLMKVSLEYAKFSIATAFFMGWFNSLCGVFNGSTNTKISMILSTCRLLAIRMPLVYILERYTNLGYTSIWISMILSNLVICIVGQIIYNHYPWQTKQFTI